MKDGLNTNKDVVTRAMKELREEVDQQAEENHKLMVNLVSKSDMEKVYKRFGEYASYADFNVFKERVEPLVTKCEQDLYKYERHNTQMREMIRRFDELLSDKVNKYTHKKLEEYVDETFLEKIRVQ